MPSQRVLELCSLEDSVTTELAKSPNTPIYRIVQSLRRKWRKRRIRNAIVSRKDGYSPDEVAACGKFTTRPSDLFLKVSVNHDFEAKCTLC